MKWNPLRTLAGRLVLVTIAAIAVSHIVAFTLFANERGSAFRREAEANAVDRIVVIAQRLQGMSPGLQDALVADVGDYGARFSIVETPLGGMGSGSGARIARAVGDDLNVATRARSRVVEMDLPRRWRVMRRGDRVQGRFTRPRDLPAQMDEDSPPPTFELGPGERERMIRRRVTEVTVDLELAEGRWLRTLAILPAPRPVPWSFWIAALVSMVAVGVGAALIARQIGKPLADLAGAAERLGQGETDVAAPVMGPDDVRRASTAFNAMAQRLTRQLTRQRQMLWALSHDLRTPITALRLRAELIEDDAVRQRLLGPLAEMETLTEQALALARAGASEEKRLTVDLAEIARTLCAELDEMGIAARAEAPTPVQVECRPSEIARAMRNLAENAARHGGGGVMKVYRNAAGEIVAEVNDDGPGVRPDLVSRLSEPFFRADSARSSENGAGLGLAIAAAIAEGHGGRLVLENRTPRGLSAKLILPG